MTPPAGRAASRHAAAADFRRARFSSRFRVYFGRCFSAYRDATALPPGLLTLPLITPPPLASHWPFFR